MHKDNIFFFFLIPDYKKRNVCNKTILSSSYHLQTNYLFYFQISQMHKNFNLFTQFVKLGKNTQTFFAKKNAFENRMQKLFQLNFIKSVIIFYVKLNTVCLPGY